MSRRQTFSICTTDGLREVLADRVGPLFVYRYMGDWRVAHYSGMAVICGLPTKAAARACAKAFNAAADWSRDVLAVSNEPGMGELRDTLMVKYGADVLAPRKVASRALVEEVAKEAP